MRTLTFVSILLQFYCIQNITNDSPPILHKSEVALPQSHLLDSSVQGHHALRHLYKYTHPHTEHVDGLMLKTYSKLEVCLTNSMMH